MGVKAKLLHWLQHQTSASTPRQGGVERLGRSAGATCPILLAAARNASGAAVQSGRIVL